jgi:hypothetical protein
MGTTLSFSGTLYRSDPFDKYVLRKFGGTSRTALKEFAVTLDLSSNPNLTFPISVPLTDISTIKFLYLTVFGGTSQVRLVKNGAYTNSPATVRVTNERVAGIVDGSNNVFTLAHLPVVNTENIYVNGTRQVPGAGEAYVITGSSLLFTAGNIPPADADIIADYYYTTGNQDVPVNTQNLDINVSGTLLMSEIDLNQIYVMSCPKSAVIEIVGMGT